MANPVPSTLLGSARAGFRLPAGYSATIFLSIVAVTGCRAPGDEVVTIYRDDYGIPNVFAETDEGAAYGVGYAQAEDRLVELLKQYRRAAGTMSEVFGPEFFRDDYRQRVWRHAEVSRKRYQELPERTRNILAAYVDGVRHFMKRHPESVPPWAGEPEPWMIVALGRYVIWGWPEGTAVDELRQAGIEPDPVEPRASNEWVVSGARTQSGRPIALIDPHLSWYGAFRFYESRLYGDKLKVAGVSILGSPIPSLGHNAHLSVAMTTGGPDTTDVYEVTLDPAHPGQYLYDGEWRDLRVAKEVIRVKSSDGVKSVPVEIVSTHHGPIVAHRDGKGYAVKIPYAEEVSLSQQTYEMMTARSLSEMRRALSRLQLMEQNVMVATVDGDIFYVRNGRVPIRPDGFDWSRPVPGNTSRTEWLGIHPFEDLVQITNPKQGYLQNCNVTPAVMTVDCPLTPEKYSSHSYLYNQENPYLHQRAAQTRAELDAERSLTVERALEIASSTVVFRADLWQGALQKAAGESAPAAGDTARLLQLILEWNRRTDEGSMGATAYFYWKESIYKIADEVPPERRIRGESRLGEVARQRDRAGLEPAEIPGVKLVQAVEEAAARLKADWGKVEVSWGEVFRAQREGSPRQYPIGGGSVPGMATPRAISFRKAPDGKHYFAGGGQTATQVVHLTQPPESFSLLPLGESDDPESPHFDDQAARLLQNRALKPTYFLRKEELLQHVTSTMVLERKR